MPGILPADTQTALSVGKLRQEFLVYALDAEGKHVGVEG